MIILGKHQIEALAKLCEGSKFGDECRAELERMELKDNIINDFGLLRYIKDDEHFKFIPEYQSQDKPIIIEIGQQIRGRSLGHHIRPTEILLKLNRDSLEKVFTEAHKWEQFKSWLVNHVLNALD